VPFTEIATRGCVGGAGVVVVGVVPAPSGAGVGGTAVAGPVGVVVVGVVAVGVVDVGVVLAGVVPAGSDEEPDEDDAEPELVAFTVT